ncbi:MAG: hypothetical protein ACOX2F_10730 [bacterium]
MNKRNIIMVLVLIALIGIFYLKESSTQRNVSENIEKESVKLFENIDLTSISSIKIANLKKEETYTFEKSGETWTVAEKGCQAEKDTVERILETLPKIRLGRNLGELTSEEVTEYGFNEGLEIQVGGKTFLFGRQRGAQIALKHENKVYLSPFTERYLFEKHDGNWCEKVEESEPEAVETIE